MNHPIHRITSFECVPPDALRLRFDDGLTRTIDFEPILEPPRPTAGTDAVKLNQQKRPEGQSLRWSA